MYDPTTLTVGAVISAIRDIGFIAGLVVFGWKVRDWVQPLVKFFERADKHMDIMESGMNALLTNHLKHIETDLRTLTGRKSEIDL